MDTAARGTVLRAEISLLLFPVVVVIADHSFIPLKIMIPNTLQIFVYRIVTY